MYIYSSRGRYAVGRTGFVGAMLCAMMNIASSAELVVGNTAPYSGPASSYSTVAKSIGAYLEMLNEKGGVNGTTFKFISYDDAYSPPKTVEQVRRLIESDNVDLILGLLGTAPNAAVQKYINAKKTPQLFSITASGKFNNPQSSPWTMGWLPTNVLESKVFGQYILQARPNAKIAVLYQNDDLGRDALEGLKAALGSRASEMIVSAQKYETSDPTVDSLVISMKSSGADVFYNAATAKFAAQAIKAANGVGWKPLQLLTAISANINIVLKPAGIDASRDIVSAFYLKDPTDPQWVNDPAMLDYRACMKKYYPNGDADNPLNVIGYSVAQSFQHVVSGAKASVSKEGIMTHAASLDSVSLPMLLPGIKLRTSKSDYFPIQQLQLGKFDGERWQLFGNVLIDETEVAKD